MFAEEAARGGRPENHPGPSDVEKSVHGLVSAVLAAGGNPFPPDLRDDTLTALGAGRGGVFPEDLFCRKTSQ